MTQLRLTNNHDNNNSNSYSEHFATYETENMWISIKCLGL